MDAIDLKGDFESDDDDMKLLLKQLGALTPLWCL